MSLRHRLSALTVAMSLTAVLALPFHAAEARDDRKVTIGGRELTIALADGDCFFDPDIPADRKQIDGFAATAGDGVVLLLAYAECKAMEASRKASAPGFARFGYVTIAETHLEPVFAFTQADLADAIAKALADEGVVDYRADINKLAGDLERVRATLPPGGVQQLGVVHRDRFGPVITSVLNIAPKGKPPVARVMLHQSIMLNGKVLNVVAARTYKDPDAIFDTYGDLSAVVEATAARN